MTGFGGRSAGGLGMPIEGFFEGALDGVSHQVLEPVIDLEMVRFFGPGFSGAKLPDRFMGRERGDALQDESWLATHHQEAGGEGGIKGLGEGDPKRFTRACGGICLLYTSDAADE